MLGGTENCSVSLEGLAAITVKIPLLSSTVFPAGFGSKPAPEMASRSGVEVAGTVDASVVVAFAWTVARPVPSIAMTPGQRSGSAQAAASQRSSGSEEKSSPWSQRVQPPFEVFLCFRVEREKEKEKKVSSAKG